jgi:hypothetical protein
MKGEGAWLPWLLGAIIETGLYLRNTKDLKCLYFYRTPRVGEVSVWCHAPVSNTDILVFLVCSPY